MKKRRIQEKSAENTEQTVQTASDPSARQARFRALIRGEYRAEFQRELAIALRRALRARKAEARLEGAQPEPQPDGARAEALTQTLHDGLARAQEAAWRAQETQMRADYPAFSLEAELGNPAFLRLVTDARQPLPIRQAYEAVHLDEIRETIAQEAAYRALEAVRARMGRPREGGAAPQAGLPLHLGAATPKERAALARRAAAGEQISL